MVLVIGKTDAFERKYMGAFHAIAAHHGEFVEYKRDRAARDIGLHFVKERKAGGEIVAPSLVWFQMKGVQNETFSEDDFVASDTLKIKLKVSHLQFWYMCPEPTFLALYIESKDQFFVLNLKKYVMENFGDEILRLKQNEKTISVSKKSTLDEQAFYLIARDREIEAWKDKIQDGDALAAIFLRDSAVVWRLNELSKQQGRAELILVKYGSKMRSEVYIQFQPDQGDAIHVREHWQFAMPDDLTLSFPYLDFEIPEECSEIDDEEYFEHGPIELPNGKLVYPEGVFEQVRYTIVIALNALGNAWLQSLQIMEAAGFVEFDLDAPQMVSVAPWHKRDV